MIAIALERIQKTYGTHKVIHDLDFRIESGEFVVLVGPSGCGKSTLLRMIAGLEDISGGELKFGDAIVNELSPSERNIAMVFQDYALYPHMSVEENMAFGLKMRGSNDNDVTSRIGAVAETLKIGEFLARRPAQLSGGQRQRVAMGRAIVREPNAFLFDEPLSNLDAALRVEMRLEIAKLHRKIKATTVYVTHDQVEAMTLADRIVVMNKGNVEQIGKPLDIYRKPASLFVAQFIGSPTMNALPAEVRHSSGEVLELSCIGRDISLNSENASLSVQGFTLGVRPEDLTACSAQDAWFSGELAVVERLGSQMFGYIETGQPKMLTVEFPRDSELELGQQIYVKGDESRVHLFDRKTGKRI
ncbi:sn-glycerol-3-phosphate ABC transporter ATP-binding protein UgpC [Ochrobactrum sp. Marseille-Q0166]|uniref:ABC transporter ATP-binding protein n=1 Tax=Ochrobactrum sp. Marseille-Q0166 TaxID=2761105 RepID=UPI0016557C93|nr:sn-glycerol-3-phosphate ABC transporter ATP-binding protein UgpC [Ochrobactrum sp. Marseille-Q0166]MBC8718710.1 sn-glycerol-3-phosphate ABC transporter ATP-binding protein UgpC [Ochrobactrum sp. Marseille-Q0166]